MLYHRIYTNGTKEKWSVSLLIYKECDSKPQGVILSPSLEWLLYTTTKIPSVSDCVKNLDPRVFVQNNSSSMVEKPWTISFKYRITI